MHETDDQKRERLKALVVEAARDIIARREEIAAVGATGRAVWYALLKQPVWHVGSGLRPEGFVEPDEVWREPPVIT